MESLTRLVTESLARHGFDRPLDYRRLRWSRWFRCESHHSLLLVPSKPGVFAIAEEIVDFDSSERPARTDVSTIRGEHDFSCATGDARSDAALAAEGIARAVNTPRRMLAVTEFFEADDMAFVLDRMLARPNPMRDALNSGRYFIRFVIIDDASQRRSVWHSLNQWVADQSLIDQSLADQSLAASSNASKPASSIASHFASSLELTPATEYVPVQTSLFENTNAGRTLPSSGSEPALSLSKGQAMFANAGISKNPNDTGEANKPELIVAQQLDSGAATNIHCPAPLPSGF